MRHRTIITLAATGMFILFFAISAKAHSPSEIESWEQEWEQFATSLPASTNPALASALQHELDRARYWFEARHQCHYHGIDCPEIAEDAPVAPQERSSSGMGTNVEQWRNLVSVYFPADQIDNALAVMRCESGGNPAAYNPSTATGLMQVKSSLWGYFGDLFDPQVNLEAASYVWRTYGWTAWSAWNRGCAP